MSELRFDPIKKSWTAIATNRGRLLLEFLKDADSEEVCDIANCPFCVGNEQSTAHEIFSIRNNNGWDLRVVPNRYPIFQIEGSLNRSNFGMYDTVSGIGANEVIIDSKRHKVRINEYTEDELANLFTAFKARICDLENDVRLKYILAIKNIGKAAGATLSHSHAQIVATPIIPSAIMTEVETSSKYYAEKERCLFCDIVNSEVSEKARIVYENYDFVAICPYASINPFEVAIYPKRHSYSFTEVSESSIRQLADTVREIFIRLSTLLDRPAITMALHTSPPTKGRTDMQGNLKYLKDSFHWHIEIRPILLRQTSLEWASGLAVNPVEPEVAAQYIKEVTLK